MSVELTDGEHQIIQQLILDRPQGPPLAIEAQTDG